SVSRYWSSDVCSSDLLFIGETIAVAVRITVITNAVTVKIAPLGGIVWEGIVRIRHAIPVSIIIQGIRNTITIEIRRRAAGIIGIKPKLFFEFITDAITVAIWITVIANAITIQIRPFGWI